MKTHGTPLDVATPDEELLARLAGGDVAAIGALYDRHAAELHAHAVRILGDRGDAEDAVHDVFVAARDRAARFDPRRGTVGAWLSTMVRNLSIDRVRSKQRRARLRRDLLGHEPGPSTRGPEREAIAAQEGAALRRAMAKLPDVQRATLEIAFFDELTYSQIAARLGVSIGTIKSRASRAMAFLRAEYVNELRLARR